MSPRVEVWVPAWSVAFAVYRLTETERTELRAIRSARAFTEQLLTLSVRFLHDGVPIWPGEHTRAPSAYPADHLEPLLSAALELNALTLPKET